MDPLTILGGVAASAQLLQGLQKTTFGIIELYRGVRDINDSTQSLQEQLEALQFVLYLLGNEATRISARSTLPATPQDGDPLRNVLESAGRTLARLERILRDITQSRKVGAQLRQYLCARSYEVTLRDLREHLVQYVQIINIALTTISSRHSRDSSTEQHVFIQVITNQVNALEESQTRLVSDTGVSISMSTLPATPPAKSHQNEDATSGQPRQTVSQSEGEGPSRILDAQGRDSNLIAENLELVGFGRTVVSSIRAAASSMRSETGAPTVRDRAVLSSHVDNDMLHPQADAISLHPIFSRQSRDFTASYVDQLEKELRSGLTMGNGSVERDDGVPTDFDRRVFNATLAAARKHSSEKQYNEALIPLEIILRKARAFAFIDDVVEKEVTHLMASALVHSNCPDDFLDRILRLYPSVTQEVLLVGFEKAKMLAAAEKISEAVLCLDKLLGYPQNYPDSEISVPDEAPPLMAACLARSDLPAEAKMTMAFRFPKVDHCFVDILTNTVLRFDQNRQWIKSRTISTSTEAAKIIREAIGLARGVIEGWSRLRTSRKLVDNEEIRSKLLTVALANLLTDLDQDDQEGEQLLLHLVKHPHLDIKVRARAERVLALIYLRRVDDWKLAREHAEGAARLYSKCQSSGTEYTACIELFVRTCELLGDPEGTYTLVELPSDWERTILPTHNAFIRTCAYLTNLGKEHPARVAALALEFLKRHYVHYIINSDGNSCEACWTCIHLSMKDPAYPFVGHLGVDELCPQRKCVARLRYPVLEFLASSKPAVKFSTKSSSVGRTVTTMGYLMSVLIDRSKNGSMPRLDFARLSRFAVINGNASIIRLLLDAETEPTFSELALPNQIQHIKDGILSLTDIIPGATYEEACKPTRQQRSADENQMLNMLVRRLSLEGLARTLRQTFLPNSVWDYEVLAIINDRYFKSGGQELKDGTILRNVLFNVAIFLGASVRKRSDPILQLAERILSTFIHIGQSVKAAIGARSWEQLMNRISSELASSNNATTRCDELTSTSTNTYSAAISDDMRNFLSNVCQYFRQEVDKSLNGEPIARNKKREKGLWPW